MGTRRLVVIHGGQQMRRGGGVCLGGCHLVHQVVGVHSLVLLRLRVEQLRVEGGAKVLRDLLGLADVVVGEEVAEVVVAVVRAAGEVEGVGLEGVALRPKVRRVVLRQALAGLQEALVQARLVRELLCLGCGQELRVVEAGGRDGEVGGAVAGQGWIEAQAGDAIILEGAMGGRRGLP